MPVVFLAVAAFLLNVVLGRLVHSQREQMQMMAAAGLPVPAEQLGLYLSLEPEGYLGGWRDGQLVATGGAGLFYCFAAK